MKCTECGSTMIKAVGDHVYRESGMDHVVLHNITTYTCPDDGRVFVQIPAIAKLHRALALAIADKPARLVPSEVRFLRDHLELSNTAFADIMGVSPSQSSRWTTSEPVGPQAERFLRMLAVLGPERVAPEEPVEVSGEPSKADAQDAQDAQDARGRVAEATLVEMARVIRHLPTLSSEVKSVNIGLRRSSAGWRQDVAMNN